RFDYIIGREFLHSFEFSYKNSTIHRRVRFPTPAQLIRLDLECKTRTNLPINHCAEMLTLTLRSGAGLFAQPRWGENH
ncbi:hypothetical protein, partial [Streptococcus suis]|uniref:hypothetical protein n=1 Tax=Streptococcus suis TaxID=1307 RepID=UPI001E626BFB